MPAISATNASVCRFCGGTDVATIDSRPGSHPGWRRRRRRCMTCDKRWSSMELPIEDIERMLRITHNLDDLQNAAMSVINQINALRSLKDSEEELTQRAETGRDRVMIEERTLTNMSA